MKQSHANVAGGFAGWADCHAAWKTANDCANDRCEFDSGLRNNQAANGQIGYQSMKTVTLAASNKGVRYTPVGAGIRIDDRSGTSEILITQIQSDGLSLPPVNTPPSLAQQISDVQMNEDTQRIWSVPAGAFADINNSDTLNYTVALANEQPLPAWLSFDPVSRQFTAQPGNAQVGDKPLYTASSLRIAPSWRSTANRRQYEGLTLWRAGLAGSDNPDQTEYYDCDSTPRNVYKGKLPERLLKPARNDDAWRIAL